MRVIVDRDKCESHARCMGSAPEVFVVDDDDQLHILQEEPSPGLHAAVEEAVRNCPKQALALLDVVS